MELLNIYSFFTVEDPQAFGETCYAKATELELTGTLLFAKEGVNWALSGLTENLEKFLAIPEVESIAMDPNCLRRTKLKAPAFRKLKLKVKEEIVTSHFNVGIKEEQNKEAYLSPEEFQKIALAPKEEGKALLLDMRNDYEYAIGTFEGALHLPLNEFHELPQHIEELAPYRGRPLLTFCTGGVRCEKAIPLLRKHGFQAYQLHGGILHYLEKYGETAENLWKGECFVFDDRVAVTSQMQKGSYHWCSKCGQPSHNNVCVVCDNNNNE